MRPLRYSINVTLDGCCHHEAGLPPDEESMSYWTAEMERLMRYEQPRSSSRTGRSCGHEAMRRLHSGRSQQLASGSSDSICEATVRAAAPGQVSRRRFPWADCGSATSEEALGLALAALDPVGDEHPEHQWVLVTW